MDWLRDRIALRDPGWLNARLGARAALSTLAAWYAIHLVFRIASAQARPAAMVYAAAVSFFCYFLIAEHRSAPRRQITLLAVVPATASVVVSLALADKGRYQDGSGPARGS